MENNQKENVNLENNPNENNPNENNPNEGNLNESNNVESGPTKFCKHCGEKISLDAVICIKCGRQVEQLAGNSNNNAQPIIINNSANATANATVIGMNGSPKNKATAIILCLLGFVLVAGIHKFYEGKIFMGIIYLCTAGLCGIGTLIDLIVLIGKPSTYYV